MTARYIAGTWTTHGTWNAYVTARCRCDACTDAWRVYRRAYRARIRAKGLAQGDPRHGTSSGYRDYGCRCDICKAGVRAGATRTPKPSKEPRQ